MNTPKMHAVRKCPSTTRLFGNGHRRQSPVQKAANFHKVKKNKGLCGGVPRYAAQATPPFDAEIVEKGHLWMETSVASQKYLSEVWSIISRWSKSICSLRDHFGDASRTSLNHRNSGLSALRQSVILDAPFGIRLHPKMLKVVRKKVWTPFD